MKRPLSKTWVKTPVACQALGLSPKSKKTLIRKWIAAAGVIERKVEGANLVLWGLESLEKWNALKSNAIND